MLQQLLPRGKPKLAVVSGVPFRKVALVDVGGLVIAYAQALAEVSRFRMADDPHEPFPAPEFGVTDYVEMVECALSCLALKRV